MAFEVKNYAGLSYTTLKSSCLGPMDATIQEKLRFPDDINEIHVCQARDNCYLLRTTVKALDEVENFLQKWTKQSRVVWRVNKTCPRRNAAGLKNIYWKEFRCQSSNLKVSKSTKKLHKKHTDCQAYMSVTIKKIPRRCRSRDAHLPKYPTIIKINNNHNHPIQHTDYLKNCPVSQETKIKFLKMFKKGHTVLSALNLHRIDLQGEYGNSIVFSEMDRSICPDNQWCYRLYASFLANKETIPDSEPEPDIVNHLAITYDSSSSSKFDNSCDTTGNNALFSYSDTECCPIENIIYDDDSPMKIEFDVEDEDDDEDNDLIDGHIILEEHDDSLDERCSFKDILEERKDHLRENFQSKDEVYLPPTELTEQQIKNFLAPFMKLMRIKLKNSPELFAPAMEIFNSRLKYFENDLDISEALYKFGKL